MSPRSSLQRKPVLIIQHAPHEHPAAVLRALETQGVLTQWIHPYRGEVYPTVDTISGLISLGGPMSANDDLIHPWIPKELGLLKCAVEAEIPTVGICLGGQLMARALGGRVEKHTIAEVGWHEIRLNEFGLQDPVLNVAGESPTVYQWHGDTFFPPQFATSLASSPACERQAYRLGSHAYGFQFHPEADHQLVHEWLEVAGVEDEIKSALKEYGPRTVQDASTQRRRAQQDETANIRITASISTLFRAKPAREPSVKLLQRLDGWKSRGAIIEIEYENPSRKRTTLRGHISSLMGVGDREFVFFRDDQFLLWPIRTGDILSAKEIN